jgi:serine/threonine-protein kinase
MPPSVGLRFGRYELTARLGAGGMGEVWRAHDHDLNRDVAAKFLPDRFAGDAVRLGRFAQEARAASGLNHPNIITIHDIGQTSGMPFIVMELVEGQTLRMLLEREGPIACRRLLDVGMQIADGLAKAHGAGIVHRDLKPENVMVTSDGFVKLLDFGLAKLRADPSGDGEHWFDSGSPTWPGSPSPQTAVGLVLGTAGYMSPEQARGRPVDFRTDQFATGAILYELATGRQAFLRETTAQTLTAIIEDAPEPIATYSPACPAPLRWLIEGRCLAKDPAERYASTLDLARELRQLREHITEAGSTVSSRGVEPAGDRRRRHLRWLAALAAAAVVGVGSWLGAPLVGRLRQAREPLPSEKRIAVLPFEPASESDEDRATANGVVYLLTARLAQLEPFQRALWVEPASNVLQSRIRSARQAAQAFNATLVVTGSVQRVAGRQLFTANLEDARASRTLRAATAERPDQLSDEIIRQLRLELGQEARAALRASETGVAEAAGFAVQGLGYTPYSEGRNALERYEQTPSLERAIDAFNRALAHDPRYALAHAGLGEAYWRMYRNERRPELVELAERHCARALELDDLLAPAWITLGIIHRGTGRAEQAIADFRKALDRDPRSPDAYRELAYAYDSLSRREQAEAAFRKAIELRPESWAGYNYLGGYLASRGRYPEAETAFRSGLQRAPDNARLWMNLGGVLALQGRGAEAESALRRSLDLGPSAAAASNLATVQFNAGRYADAARALEQASAGTRDYRIWRNLGAALYWAPGERPKAPAAYRKAIELAEQERKVDPRNALTVAHLADCHVMLGEAREARQRIAEAVALDPANGQVAVVVASVLERLGERRAAIDRLLLGLRQGYSRAMVEADPFFAELRKDPRYANASRTPQS